MNRKENHCVETEARNDGSYFNQRFKSQVICQDASVLQTSHKIVKGVKSTWTQTKENNLIKQKQL